MQLGALDAALHTTPMKIAVQSLMIFFGTLMAAALVALGEPANAEVAMVQAVALPVQVADTSDLSTAELARPGQR